MNIFNIIVHTFFPSRITVHEFIDVEFFSNEITPSCDGELDFGGKNTHFQLGTNLSFGQTMVDSSFESDLTINANTSKMTKRKENTFTSELEVIG